MINSRTGLSRPLVSLLLSLSLLVASVSGYPTVSPPRYDLQPEIGLFAQLILESDILERDHKPFKLKVWPLGASITWGQHSQSGNGYRRPLRDELVSDGWDVDMVGTKHNGNMTDDVSLPSLVDLICFSKD
jgi:hypothetical protein